MVGSQWLVRIAGIPDYNCDGSLRITIMGDSIAYGDYGDTQNKIKVDILRLAKKFLSLKKVANLGKPGMRSFELMSHLKDIFKTNKFESAATSCSRDVVIRYRKK